MPCVACVGSKISEKLSGEPRKVGGCGNCGAHKLTVYNWLAGINSVQATPEFVEVRFKNSRKGIYFNEPKLPLREGEVVVVEAATGHDVGIISLTGELVKLQMKKKNISYPSDKVKKIYRIARERDIEVWQAAIKLEEETKKRARQIAQELGLEMKINDVEYQGDKTKATFYYTAEGRVDFRELIKKYAREFRVKIEMRQIGMRQEAGRIGGIGSCGKELCCSTWLTDFRSVSTQAARYQQLSINPAKLAGQCGKLKCCINYELDQYLEALQEFPDSEIKLHTQSGVAVFQKLDVFKKKMWYAYENDPDTLHELDIDRVKTIIELNKKNIYPESLRENTADTSPKEIGFMNVVGQERIDRFQSKDKSEKSKDRKRNNKQKGRK